MSILYLAAMAGVALAVLAMLYEAVISVSRKPQWMQMSAASRAPVEVPIAAAHHQPGAAAATALSPEPDDRRGPRPAATPRVGNGNEQVPTRAGKRAATQEPAEAN